jgi:hypothetical protein
VELQKVVKQEQTPSNVPPLADPEKSAQKIKSVEDPKEPAEKGMNIWDRIVDALRPAPPYVLFFGLTLIFVALGQDLLKSQPYVALIFMAPPLLIVYLVERKNQVPTENQGSHNSINLDSFDKYLIVESRLPEIIRNITNNLLRALNESANPIFVSQLQEEMSLFLTTTSTWSKGELKFTDMPNYNRLLIACYKQATTKVLATSRQSYLKVWKTPVGKDLLNAQVESGAKNDLTRIFIFDNLNQIDDAAKRIMQMHSDAKIKVFVYIFQGNPIYQPGNSIDLNFALIDSGNIISIAKLQNESQFAGDFYFGQKHMVDSYSNTARRLIDSGAPLEDLDKYLEKMQPASPSTYD